MSATCDRCMVVRNKRGDPVRPCSLHAETEAMRDALAGAVDALREFIEFAPRVVAFESSAASEAAGRPIAANQTRWYIAIIEAAAEAEAAARPILARIDGVAPISVGTREEL